MKQQVGMKIIMGTLVVVTMGTMVLMGMVGLIQVMKIRKKPQQEDKQI